MMLLVAVVCVCAMDGEEAVFLAEERDRARLVYQFPLLRKFFLLCLLASASLGRPW